MTRLSILSPLLGAVAVAAQTVSQQGCYSSAGSLQSQGTYIYQSTGYCAITCKNLSKSAMALMDSECYCGDELPAASRKVDDSKCNIPCPGYPMERCGGDGFFSVALSTSDNTTSVSPTTSAFSYVAPTDMSATHTITSTSSSSTSTPASYTGAAASAYLGSGALAMGALVAFL